MSKSKRTQERYARAFRGQGKLSGFGFKAPSHPTQVLGPRKLRAVGDEIEHDQEVIAQPPPLQDSSLSAAGPSRARSASVLSDPSTDSDEVEAATSAFTTIDEAGESPPSPGRDDAVSGDEHLFGPGPQGDDSAVDFDDQDHEDLDEDLEDSVQGPKSHVRDWTDLRQQIKEHLKKYSKILPLSQINQLMILSNFATLRIKGVSRTQASLEIARQWHDGGGNWFSRRVRALAHHYQIFEKLPVEKRGGSANARSWLHDQQVKLRTRDWLTSQRTGEVTPRKLQHALNRTIFPELNIELKNPISERTARRWLIKLGWRRTIVRKGVYMDGHERKDVVEYRNKIFLPTLAKFETRMATHEGPELQKVMPELLEGQRCIIIQYHDECCFHANDEAKSLWLREGEQPLRKKSQGRLIHVSDFINEEDGRLVLLDENGQIVRDARKIIYPGSNGDPWWDNKQLMEQIKSAIEIFEAAHPDCQALFIFDQSSAHASLPPDALKAFDMNKSNGGKQRKQRDTIIPHSNPDQRFRGQPQKMTTSSGEAKGLQAVLEERGFNVSRLRAKCSPVCPFESQNCCMARLLSQQDDFKDQESMLETFIKAAGHECLFLPKFHCELNPIEMVRTHSLA
ncbi:hypothetical protein HWV62_9917 [Athelia sp. TMB]|nr:hypothetical protein HWV62_9917 [Athelia sp. TMB]